MEVDNILADKVVHFTLGVFVPVLVEVQTFGAVAQVLESRHVADRRIQPDVEVFAGLTRNLKTEVGRITGDIPVLQAAVQPLGQLVGDLFLDGAAAGPAFRKPSKSVSLKKKCSDSFSTGVAPEMVEYGFFRSVGL